jgi:probable phosphoglycerate mutase
VVTTLYLTRHGQTDLNVSRVFQDHQSSALTELGRCQAAWLSERLQDVAFDAIYASSSSRAIATAEILRGQRDLEIVTLDALREIDVGSWTGQKHDEIRRLFPLQGRNFFEATHLYVPVSGESFADVKRRAIPVIDKIIAQNAGKTVLIVTHSITLKTILNHFEGRSAERFWDPPHIKQTSLSIVEVDNGNARIRLYADTAHYQDVPSPKAV